MLDEIAEVGDSQNLHARDVGRATTGTIARGNPSRGGLAEAAGSLRHLT